MVLSGLDSESSRLDWSPGCAVFFSWAAHCILTVPFLFLIAYAGVNKQGKNQIKMRFSFFFLRHFKLSPLVKGIYLFRENAPDQVMESLT